MANRGARWIEWLRRLFGFEKQTVPGAEATERTVPAGTILPPQEAPVPIEEVPLVRQQGLRSSPNRSGSQTGSLDRAAIDAYKRQMLHGSFFSDPNNKIAGYYDDGRLIVTDGHHRIQAAMELYNETRNAYYLNQLLRFSMAGFTEPSGIPGIRPRWVPGPLEEGPPPPGWGDGPFPPAEPQQP